VVKGPETILVEKIKRAREKVVEKMKKAGIKVLKEEKVYMLKDKESRLEVIRLHHNILVAEYKGR